MQTAEVDKPPSPSNVIKQITITLLGLSYGEHDGGVQRKHVSNVLANILEKWSCGLLAVDLSAKEQEAIFDAFDEFILARPALNHFEWKIIHPNVLGDVVSMYWKRSLHHLKDRGCATVSQAANDNSTENTVIPAEGLPVGRSLRALSVALIVFERVIALNNGSRCAGGDALAHFLFASFWLKEILTQYSLPNRDSVRDVLNRTHGLLQKAKHDTSLNDITARVARDIVRVASSSVRADADATDGERSRRLLRAVPALCGLHAFVEAILKTDENRIVDLLPELLELLRENFDVPQQDLRIAALDTLGLLHNQLPYVVFVPYLSPLVTALPHAFLWHDVMSATRAAPLITAFASYTLPKAIPPPLAESAPREWDGAFSSLFAAMQRHVNACLLNRSFTDAALLNDKPREHVYAAAVTLSVIPPLAQHRLITRVDEFMSSATKLLPCAAGFLCKDTVPFDVIVLTANAICDALAHAWCRAPALRASVFASVVAAVLEVREASDSVKKVVTDACQDIIVRLAIIDAHAVRFLIHNTRHTAEKRPSLRAVVHFLNSVNPALYAGSSKERTSAGPLVRQFFSDMTTSNDTD